MSHTLDNICKKLQERNYKITPQREVIFKTFIENKDKHLSAEDIYNLVREINPDIGLATVYRTLELLAEINILNKLNFDDGKTRYEFNDKEIHQHHHLICLKCDTISEFEDDLLEKLEAAITKNSGFKIVDHNVIFYGYCKECQ